ncbi:hypothetical protein [Dongia sp.]|uniref:hypothetical protein n=1 Tax=Dongia sp. TaxID=1977262 RepID=UPI003751F50A
METLLSTKLPRRRVIGLAVTVAGLLLAGCAPQQPPAPGSWQEEYYRRKEKYRQWGEGQRQ